MKWKADLPSIGRKYSCHLILLLLLAIHLPFAAADPDVNISSSRGPFTDEGQNTLQVRDLVNHGYLDLKESDNLLKTPLFGFSLIPAFKIFGTSLPVARLHVLLLLLTALAVICRDRKHREIVMIFIAICLLQFQVFQFSHFSLAEMLSCASTLLSVHFLARSVDLQFDTSTRRNEAILAGVFISLSYYFKIQFIYLVMLLPLTQLISLYFAKPLTRKLIFRQGMMTSAILFIFLLIYLFAWYLPNREIYDFMMSNQSGAFSVSAATPRYMAFNLMNYFLRDWMIAFSIGFAWALFTGLLILVKGKYTSRFPALFIASAAWVFLESHKLTMVYLPTRYRISLMIAMGLLMSVVMHQIFSNQRLEAGRISRKILNAIAFWCFFAILSVNIFNYFNTLNRRSYVIREMNAYLARSLSPDDVALGAWAPSLTWESKSRAYPVWNHFLNYRDPINTFNPRVVITEKDEQDAEQTYISQGIILAELADSSRIVKIGQWDVAIYWLEPPPVRSPNQKRE